MSSTRRLYHCTYRACVPEIRRSGWRETTYVSEDGLEPGVWLCEDPNKWALGRDALLAVDFEDDELEEAWRSQLLPDEWQIPVRYLEGRTIREVERPPCSQCGKPATVLLVDEVWLCQRCSDELGRKAMEPG